MCSASGRSPLETGKVSPGGNSGSYVWDAQGRAGGMLTSGVPGEMFGVGNDVTYITPIEWLLEDIREHGFEVEIV